MVFIDQVEQHHDVTKPDWQELMGFLPDIRADKKGVMPEMARKATVIKVDAGWSKRDNKDALAVSVRVTNEGAGHLIPTGIPGIREMWLEVSVSSGQQSVATAKRALGLELFDAAGKTAMPWDAVTVGKDTHIGPKETRKEKFTFKLTSPSDVRVEAKLLERLVSEQAASIGE